MGWRPKGKTPTALPRTGSKLNRECRWCIYPCTGGEVLHRRGYCCHDWCGCMGFEPVPAGPEFVRRYYGVDLLG